MSQAVFALTAVVLVVGSASWAVAAFRLRRWAHEMRREGNASGDADRIGSLAARDGLVAALFGLVGMASAVRAVTRSEPDAADWALLAAFVPVVASLPFLGRFQGTTELARDRRTETEHRRLELLYEVAAAGEELDVDASSQRIARALVPDLGDWAVVVLLAADGSIEAMGLATSDDEIERLDRLLEDYPVNLDLDEGIGRAIRSGERVRYDDIGEELLSTVAEDERHLELMRALDLRSSVIEPLVARGQSLGALAVIGRGDRQLGDDVADRLAELAAQAAPLLDNARLHRNLLAAQRELRFREEILRAQGESGVEGLLVVAPDGSIISFNRRFAQMWGLDEVLAGGGTDDEALAAAAARVVDPERFVAGVRAAYEEPRVAQRDEVHFRDGRVLDRYGAPLTSDDGTYLGWAWYFRDITEEREAQRELRASSDRFRTLARTLQESLLPPDLPHIAHVDIAARFHPAGDGTEIGGDFYDVFQVDEHEWCAVVGDVCGKGAGAARLTALARYTLRASTARSARVDRNLTELNAALFSQSERDRARNEHRFATAAVLRFRAAPDGITVRAASAGHLPPLLVRRDGSVDPLACRGTLLGVFDQVSLRTVEVRLDPGDIVVLFTDGVTEARDGDEEFGDGRLVQLLGGVCGHRAESVVRTIEESVLAYQGGTARDDIAVVALRSAPGEDPETGSIR